MLPDDETTSHQRAGAAPAPARGSLGEIAVLFLRLGATAFGGPAAHIAMMEDEVVSRRRWLTRSEFLDLLGAANFIPGPNSTELAIFIGHARAGVAGLLVAGLCFILPAAAIVGALAWAYVKFGTLPAFDGLLYGVKPVVIAIVVQALWRLGRPALRSPLLAFVAGLTILAVLVGIDELIVLGSAAVVGLTAWRLRRSPGDGTTAPPDGRAALIAPIALTPFAQTTAAGAAGASIALWPIFAVFAKIGAVLFGSGYVLLAFLRSEMVVARGWLSEAQLLDAVAIGQVTPGPVFTTATFVGYLLAGGSGAVMATMGIFLPAFVFVALSGPLLPRVRRSPAAGATLDAVTAASLALMAVVTVQLARAALVDVVTVILAIVSALLLLRYRVNSAWIALGGLAAGWIVAR